MDYDPFYALPYVQNRELSYVPTGAYAGGGGPGGSPGLFDIAGSNIYRAPFNPPSWSPSLSPLAGTPLGNPQSFMGFAANMAGNYYIGSQLKSAGLSPLGNTGSYLQALRLREQQQRVAQVNAGLKDLESDNIFGQLKGIAAVTGFMGPMDTKQAEALRGMADMGATYMPMLQADPRTQWMATILAGQRGSIYSMASPMMDANRFNRDTLTGQQGYSAESNQQLIRGVYDELFKNDARAKSLGLRTEEYGAAYRALSAESLVGPKGDLRTRTIDAAKAVMAETGTDLAQLVSGGGGLPTGETDINRLGDEQLQSLRQNATVQQQLRKSDTRQITEQLKGYGESLAAIKEVFTESGQDASVPKLINALKALTNNRLGSFSTAELKNLARDLQAISQTTGKNIDEVFALHQASIEAAERMLGPAGAKMAPEITKMQAAAGMSYRAQGAMTGDYAMDQRAVEAAAGQFYARTLKSETTNMLGMVQRLEEAGAVYTDTPAGRRMKAAIEAAKAGKSDYEYTDEKGQVRTARTPTRSVDIMQLVPGAFQDVEQAQVGLMLSQTAPNLFAAGRNEASLNAASRLAGEATRREAMIPALLSQLEASTFAKSVKDPKARAQMLRTAADEISKTLLDAEQTPEAMLQPAQRTQLNAKLTERVAQRLADAGAPLTAEQKKALPMGLMAAKETIDAVVQRRDMDPKSSLELFRRIDANTLDPQKDQMQIRGQLNEAMSPLSRLKGSTAIERFAAALTKAGDIGDSATFSQLVLDTFGDDVELLDEMKGIRQEQNRLSKLESQILDTKSPEERARLLAEAERGGAELRKRTEAIAEKAQRTAVIKSLKDSSTSVIGDQITRASISNVRISAQDFAVAATGDIARTAETLPERAARMAGFQGENAVAEFDKSIAASGNTAEERAKARTEKLIAASKQLTVQGQLSAAGVLNDPEAAVYDRESLLAQLPEDSPLRTMLAERQNDDWTTVSQDFLNLRTMQMFQQPEEKIIAEQDRRSAEAQKLATQTQGVTLSQEFAHANAFLTDTANLLVTKKGLPQDAAASIKDELAAGQKATEGLNELATKYFDGSVSTMLLSEGVGITTKGREKLKEEFDKLTTEERKKFIEQAGLKIAPEQLTAAHYGAKVVSDMRSYISQLNTSVEKAGDRMLQVPGLVTDKQGQNDALAPMYSLLQQFGDGFRSLKANFGLSGTPADESGSPVTPGAGPVTSHKTRSVGVMRLDENPQLAANSSGPKELKLTGTVEFRGDVVGQGTLVTTAVGSV